MKKILLILALVLSICVCFVSCGEDTGDNGGVQNGGNAEGGDGTEDNGDADFYGFAHEPSPFCHFAATRSSNNSVAFSGESAGKKKYSLMT